MIVMLTRARLKSWLKHDGRCRVSGRNPPTQCGRWGGRSGSISGRT